MSKTTPIELIEYTDPYCTWCWGSEPILRRVEAVYGDQVHLDYVMGGLTDDASSVNDPANGIGGPDWKQQLAAHWLEASGRHGMPVDVSGFDTVTPTSTFPSNIAYEAVKLQRPELAHAYLRRLREAAATEGRALHEPEVLAEIADEFGVDRARFLADMDGAAKTAFDADRRECMMRDAHGFPTFLVRGPGGERLLRGYQRFASFEAAIDAVAGTPLEKRQPVASDDTVLAFVRAHGSAASREVQEVFGVSAAQADGMLERLATAGLLAARPSGTGILYRVR